MLRNKFVVVCKCPGGGALLTVNCPSPGTRRETNARGLPGGGGTLAVGIDSYINITINSILGFWIYNRGRGVGWGGGGGGHVPSNKFLKL